MRLLENNLERQHEAMEDASIGTEETQDILFKCPQCGGDVVMEFLVNYGPVTVYEDGREPLDMDDGIDTYEDDNVRYFCFDCGFFIADDYGRPVTRQDVLTMWMKRQNGFAVEEIVEEVEYDDEREIPELEYGYIKNTWRLLEPGEIRFVCPKCGDQQLHHVINGETFIFFSDDWKIDYGKEYLDHDSYHYRCSKCKWIVEDDALGRISDIDVMRRWLKANCDQTP